MNQQPEPRHPDAPHPDARHPDSRDTDARGGFTDPAVVGFVAYVVFPVLALVTAALGLILILNDRIVPGMVFLAIILQVWVIGGLWAHFRRRRLVQPAGHQPGSTVDDGTATS